MGELRRTWTQEWQWNEKSETDCEECICPVEDGNGLGRWEVVRGEPILRLPVGLSGRMVRASIGIGSSGGEHIGKGQ